MQYAINLLDDVIWTPAERDKSLQNFPTVVAWWRVKVALAAIAILQEPADWEKYDADIHPGEGATVNESGSGANKTLYL